MAKGDESQCMVIVHDLPQATPAFYGPGSREDCEAAAEKLGKPPRNVEHRDVVVTELQPLP